MPDEEISLDSEALRASEMLGGKVLTRVMRPRATEVLLEFTDGTQLFVDRADDALELSVTEGKCGCSNEVSPEFQSITMSPAGIPEVESVNFDLWTLRISVRHLSHSCPRYVDFDGVVGFRVLDEGDLTNFWQPAVRVDGWLWQVTRGGWLQLEASRSDFIQHPGAKEYLILGRNECVSVIAHSAPVVREASV